MVNKAGKHHTRVIEQVWFPGNHGDVGGGWPSKERALSTIALHWMCEKANKLGLPLYETARVVYGVTVAGWPVDRAKLHELAVTPGAVHDPFKTGDRTNLIHTVREVDLTNSTLHDAVKWRMASNAIRYAPTNPIARKDSEVVARGGPPRTHASTSAVHATVPPYAPTVTHTFIADVKAGVAVVPTLEAGTSFPTPDWFGVDHDAKAWLVKCLPA